MLASGLNLVAEPWRRHRVGLCMAAGSFAILLVATRLSQTDFGEAWWLIPVLIVMTLSVAWGYVLNSILFLDREGDLSSGYPRRLFTLPVATSTLAFWPMFMNVATVSALWLLTIAVYPGRYLWPPALLQLLVLCAAASWLQAMVWCPFGTGWYRLSVCLVVSSGLVGPPLALAILKRDMPWDGLAFLYILIAWGVAYWAVSRARRGDVWMPWLPGARLWETFSQAIEHRRGFGSPASAQLWYEARCHLWMLPVVTFWFLGFFGFVLSFTPLQADRPGFVTPFLFGLAAATPVVMAISVSIRLGGFEPFWRFTPTSIGFVGTRPMTTQALVVSKFRIALLSVLLTWAGVAAFVLLAVIGTGNWSYTAELARTTAARYDGRSVWLLVGLALIVGPALSWNCLTSGLPASLRGRRWGEVFSWTFAGGMMALTLPIISYLGSPNPIPFLLWKLPWIIGALALVKAVVAVVGFRKAIARRLIDGRYTASAVTMWLAVALVLSGFVWLAASPYDHVVSVYAMLGAGAVISPLGRFALAPLALDRNRHQ